MENDDRKWEILQSEYLIKRPWLTARRDRVRLPNGVINDEYYVLEYPDWVNVIAITKEGDFLMERQYRHGLQWTGYELCAGVCEAGEDPLESARRELYEETGYAGGEWVKHMTISANTSTMTNLCHCFVATGVERVSGQHLEETEDISDQRKNLRSNSDKIVSLPTRIKKRKQWKQTVIVSFFRKELLIISLYQM